MTTFRSTVLSRVAGLRHVFAGRGDLARPAPEDLVDLLGGRGDVTRVARLRQIHSDRCLVVQTAALPPDGMVGDGDALATSNRRIALAVATADCLPMIAVDAEAGALAVVHAGWRGTLAGVLVSAIGRLKELGARPERIALGAGPAVGVCCYRVGPEVVEAFARSRPAHVERIVKSRPDGASHLDLLEANRLQAIDAGIDPASVDSVGVCTVCLPDLTHSYRREGSSAGRMWALAALE